MPSLRIRPLPWLLAGLLAVPLARATESSAVHPGEWPRARSPVTISSETAELVERLLAAMTPEEKVGQLLQADIDAVKPADVQRYHLGSVLAGGNAAPGHDVRASPVQWQMLTERYFEASLADQRPGRSAVPILFGIDAVHGNARIPGATVFPHNVGLGAMHDAPLMRAIGEATAQEVAAIGADWTFAPDVAVVRDVRWGRSYESWSEDPALVAAYAAAVVTGLQGTPGTASYFAHGRVLASVKHFLGDGSTLAGRDQFDSEADEATLRSVHGAGYVSAIEAGALNVMASYNGWQGTKMHANRGLLTDVLRGRWSFPGFVVGDWNAQEEIPGCSKYDCPQLLLAGVDMYMAPDSWKKLYANLLAQVRSGAIPMTRLDEAVGRILTVKALMHRLNAPESAYRPQAGELAQLGSAAHRALARQAVRESLVLLKNNGRLLPLDPHARVLVAGAAADSIGAQSGGWTIDWQGDHNSNADFPGATSIFAGIRAAVSAAGGEAEFSAEGTYRVRPAVAIVVFGESPYAEFEGDRENLALGGADGAHLALLARLKRAGIPVVGVLLSGRPLWINRELNLTQALVAAWLPGSEGAGVADLLFRAADGQKSFDFAGRLGFSWPATALPVRIGADQAVTGALFPRGYGLTYASASTVAQLAQDPATPGAQNPEDALFAAGHVIAPWSVFVEDPIAPVRLTMKSQASPGATLTTTLTTAGLQAVWSGKAIGELRIGGRAQDLRARTQSGTALIVRYRLVQPPTSAVTLGMRCEAPYGTRPPLDTTTPPIDWRLCGSRTGVGVDITASLRGAPLNTWQNLTIPLHCMADDKSDLRNVNAPLAIATAGTLSLEFEAVRLAVTEGACPVGPAGMLNLVPERS